METKEPNLAAFNEYICIQNYWREHEPGEYTIYNEGQCYWFGDDQSVDDRIFKLVVDETDTPIKKLVRWD